MSLIQRICEARNVAREANDIMRSSSLNVLIKRSHASDGNDGILSVDDDEVRQAIIDRIAYLNGVIDSNEKLADAVTNGLLPAECRETIEGSKQMAQTERDIIQVFLEEIR